MKALSTWNQLAHKKSQIKVIEDTRANTKALYTLVNDPQEKHNHCLYELELCQQNTKLLNTLVHLAGKQPIERLKN